MATVNRKAEGSVKAPGATVVIPKKAVQSAPAQCDKRRILIVDDQRAVCDVFKQVIAYGLKTCRVDIAVNGAEAVGSFRAAHQGLIIMDLHMPVMDGETAFYEIQKVFKEENLEMPAIVFCTGYDASEKIEKEIEKNPIHCTLKKPVTDETLLAAIRARLKCQ